MLKPQQLADCASAHPHQTGWLVQSPEQSQKFAAGWPAHRTVPTEVDCGDGDANGDGEPSGDSEPSGDGELSGDGDADVLKPQQLADCASAHPHQTGWRVQSPEQSQKFAAGWPAHRTVPTEVECGDGDGDASGDGDEDGTQSAYGAQSDEQIAGALLQSSSARAWSWQYA